MNKYVVILSIGPVQSMIASARRSRDLWSGSWLLSELAKAGANALWQTNGVELIFPSIQKDSDLSKNSSFSVGNKLQAVISAENTDALKQIIDNTKQAIHARFDEESKNALHCLKNKQDIRTDIWHEQIQDFVEVQSAWAKIIGDNNTHGNNNTDEDPNKEDLSYTNAVQLASQVLASRKATRDFLPSANNPYQAELMIPKSSLDGLRESVLKEDDNEDLRVSPATRMQLSLSPSEQLDAVGIIKRLGFDKTAEQFTPISRIMADAWLEKLTEAKVDLSQIKDICQQLYDLGVMTYVKGNKGIYDNFAYDAQLLYPSRIEASIQQWKGADDAVTDCLDLLKKALKPLWREYGEPCNYGALLLADGDRMGELLDHAKNQTQHQAITKALSNFAQSVEKTMRSYRGHCIYAGGDDVLGFVPLDKAYACANALQQQFAKSLNDIAEQLKAENKPTLSVGIAICHLMTPLGIMRQLASQAEKYAKGDHITKESKKETDKQTKPVNERRNALCFLLSVRGGSDIQLRLNWHDDKGHEFLNQAIGYYTKKDKANTDKDTSDDDKDASYREIPSRIAYDIRAIHLRTKNFAPNDGELLNKIQSAELTRMLEQARTDAGKKIRQDIKDELIAYGQKIGLDKLADKLIVARWLATKTQKDLGKE